MNEQNEPESLQEAIQYFTSPDNCLRYLAARRWRDGVVRCPNCDSDKVAFIPTRRLWECKSKHAKRQFSVKVGTVMEDSAIRLDKWLMAMWMLANCKNGVSSWELHRTIKVTQKTAWFMLHRLRYALQDDPSVKIGGPGETVEVDETYIGGKARNMHRDRRARLAPQMQGGKGKAIVIGMLERGGKVKAQVIPRRWKEHMQGFVRDGVESGATVMTDEASMYLGLKDEYVHEIINHMECYVRGHVSTNGIENFWSLLKRGLGGTYVSVEPFHLFRYLDEQMFRYNNRATKDNPLNDANRFDLAVSQIVNKRLTYAELTGKVGETAF